MSLSDYHFRSMLEEADSYEIEKLKTSIHDDLMKGEIDGGAIDELVTRVNEIRKHYKMLLLAILSIEQALNLIESTLQCE